MRTVSPPRLCSRLDFANSQALDYRFALDLSNRVLIGLVEGLRPTDICLDPEPRHAKQSQNLSVR